jgi:hypothetical protein
MYPHQTARSQNAQCHAPVVSAGATSVWCRAWIRPGRTLGYLVDRAWGMSGGAGTPLPEAVVRLGDEVTAGSMHLEWWDPDHGTIISQTDFVHPGQALELHAPPFSRHLAFKLWRP